MVDESLDVTQIKSRAVRSFLSLFARVILLRAISYVTLNIVLASVLPVSTLGIFNIATAIITFFAFFSDIGLAASLIQKKEEVTAEDIKTTFTIQQLIVLSLSLLIFLAAPYFGQLYSLDESGVWLVRILGISFFLSSLKVIPSVLLERNLRFGPLVVTEIVETLIFNFLLIYLVFNNYSIWSFSVAALVRGIVGVVLIYILSPTKINIGIHSGSLRKLLSFGLPYQLNNLLALIKDRLVPLVIASIVGSVGVGFITWSYALAFLPLEIMSVVIRITFPAFSRLQDNREFLEKAVEKSLFVTSLLVFPAIFGLAALMPFIIRYGVNPQWEPALLSFYLFSFSAFWAVISTTFTNVLNAIGKIKTTLKLMVFWTILTWILTPLLVYIYGFVGAAISSFIISFTSVITIILVKRVLTIRLLDSILLPFLISTVMAVVVYIFAQFFVYDRLTIFLAIFVGGVVYGILILLFDKKRTIQELKNLRSNG